MPEASAGKTGRCPQCKKRMTIPSVPEPGLRLVRDPAPPDPQEASKPVVRGPSGRSIRAQRAQEMEAYQRKQELLASPIPATSDHPDEQRQRGPLDLLLYPFGLTGTMTLVSIIGLAILLSLLGAVIPISLLFHSWLFLMIDAAVTLYIGWYLAECVYDSAKGGTRAPEILDADTSIGNMWSRVPYLLAVYIIYGLPPVLYQLWIRQSDAVFWALAVWAVVFFPMGLLAMVMHDSVSALNPLFLLGSIRRVCCPYLGLLVSLAVMAGLFVVLPAMLAPAPPPGAVAAVNLISLIAGAYGSFLFAHVLGRFYRRHRDRLDWGI